MKSEKFWKTIIFFALVVWFCFLMAQRIDLSTADLGRHLKNGELLANSGYNLTDKNSLLFENFYSYTNPDFPFTNHHWASGVVFFRVYKLVGFSGLSIFYIVLSAITFVVFFYIARRESNFMLAAILSFFLIPLMAERHEIRPEGFSYLLAAVFFLALWLWQKKEISSRWLFVLPVAMIFWVNLHVYFFLGVFLMGVFLFSEISGVVFSRLTDEEFRGKIQNIKWLLLAFFLTSLGMLVNPFGLKLALHPLNIYKNYGYTVLEEKSVWFLENYGIANPNFAAVKTILILFAVGFIPLLFVNRKKISIRYLFLAIFFGAVGWMALRNFSLLGFFSLPILGYLYFNIFRQKEGEMNIAKEYGMAFLYIAVILVGIYVNYQFVFAHSKRFGVGLEPGVQKAAEFAKENKISGPIFNDYDIGGYLIWNFFPEEKVFVDNRPEVYPNSFFSDVYKPMQENPDIFKKIDEEYNFNTIFFYRNDITPWGMNLPNIIKESQEWSKVFEDDYAVIYLKENEKNMPIIEKYQILDTKN
jgi:hypothetical protein